MSSQETLITTHSVETPSGRISYASAGSGPAALRASMPISIPMPMTVPGSDGRSASNSAASGMTGPATPGERYATAAGVSSRL
jgi:hypothetical protein